MLNMKVDMILKTNEYQGNIMVSKSWKNLSISFFALSFFIVKHYLQ